MHTQADTHATGSVGLIVPSTRRPFFNTLSQWQQARIVRKCVYIYIHMYNISSSQAPFGPFLIVVIVLRHSEVALRIAMLFSRPFLRLEKIICSMLTSNGM